MSREMPPTVTLGNIQHLRAFSVVIVVLFHLDFTFFQWGFIGVDIFFVISGFIMGLTTSQDVKFVDFLTRRIKRLAPVFLAVSITTVLIGSFFQTTSQSIVTSLTALLNFVGGASIYISETTGYFEDDALHRPLIHTWSLSIEWLCYLMLAAILIIGRTKRERALIISCVLIASLVSIGMREAKYYDIFTRVYFFLSGYLLFQVREFFGARLTSWWSWSLSAVLALVVASYLAYSALTKWPHFGAIVLPFCIAPFLFKNWTNQKNVISTCISRIGDASYSIYLWHWPVICYVSTRDSALDTSLREVALSLTLTAVLSFCSFNFLERNKRSLSLKRIFASSAIIVFLLSVNVLSHGSFPDRIQRWTGTEQIFNKKFMWIVGCHKPESFFNYYDPCIYDSEHSTLTRDKTGRYAWTKAEPSEQFTTIDTIILGDSHSRHFLPTLLSTAEKKNVLRLGVPILADGPNIKNLFSSENVGLQFSDYINKKNIQKIFFAYRFSEKSEEEWSQLETVFSKLSDWTNKNNEVKIFILRDVPSLTFDPLHCANDKKCRLKIEQKIATRQIANHDDLVWEKWTAKYTTQNVKFADTHRMFCEYSKCKVMFGNDLLYRDNNHLNENLSPDAQRWLNERWETLQLQ